MFDQGIEEGLSELALVDDAELEVVIAEAELAIRAQSARLAAAIAVGEARQLHRNEGHHSVRSFLKAKLNCSGPRANRLRRCASLVDRHPDVGDALLSGHVGVEQVDVLAKAAAHPVAGNRFGEFKAQLLDHAEQLEHRPFETVVKHFETMADPDGSFDAQRFAEDERSASVSTFDGSVEVTAHGGHPLAAAEMKAIFDAAVETELQADLEQRRAEHGPDAAGVPLARTARQRKFDALHRIFLDSVNAPADGVAPVPMVNVLIDSVTAGDALFGHGLTGTPDLLGVGDAKLDKQRDDLLARECSINGVPGHPDIATKAMLTGKIRRAVVDANRVVIDLGRSSRLFTGSARQAAQLLAVTCTHRGCDIPASVCDVDHRQPWSEGGATDQANAGTLCGSHDRHKHRARLRTRRATNGRDYLIEPTGQAVLPIGAREPAWAEPCPVTGSAPTHNAA